MNEPATTPPDATQVDSSTMATNRSSSPIPPRNSPPLPDNIGQMFAEALRRGIEKQVETP